LLDSILNINIDLIEILIISMLPITELRFSIPYFILVEELSWQKVFTISIIGNILIGVLIVTIIGPIMNFFKKNYYLSRIINYIINRTKNKSKMIEIYKFLGLVLFIGIPAPFTGVWTGSLAAYLLSFEKKKSYLGIIIGVMISATIVLIITLFVKELISLIFDF
tara:strand:- start:391 stop:885 length:495 start_codon:yes stop_codon:yes gene_type:complete